MTPVARPLGRPRDDVAAQHGRLTHRLPPATAAVRPTREWIQDRVIRYARVAGLPDPAVATTTGELARLLGRLAPRAGTSLLLGWASWETDPGVVFVALPHLGTRAAADLVAAHEITHLRDRRSGHPPTFFPRVQSLLDAAARVSGTTLPACTTVPSATTWSHL